jgi:hypothetical protein
MAEFLKIAAKTAITLVGGAKSNYGDSGFARMTVVAGV